MEETWKDIEGFSGDYQVSSFGRVKSFKSGKERILTSNYFTHDGYRMITLCKDGKWKPYRVSRLVAKAFIPNPLNLPQVNHKDEVRKNDCVENLEWCTAKYNVAYSGVVSKMNDATKKKVHQFDLQGKLVNSYQSVKDADKYTNIDFRLISRCCLGKSRTAGGYVWKYEEAI